MITSFRDLEIYSISYNLMIVLHKEVVRFPQYEQKDLVSQIRRASKSIPANIAEGWAKRTHEKEFKKHLDIALGSANEIEVHLQTAIDLRYLHLTLGKELIQKYRLLGGKIFNLKKHWQSY